MKKILLLALLTPWLCATAGNNTQKITASAPLTLTGGVMAIPAASGSVNGYLLSSDWTAFNSKQAPLTLGNLTSGTTGLTVGSGTGAVVGSGTTLSIQTATGSQPGLLSAADWTTFNGKQSALSFGNLTSGTTGVSFSSGTGAVIGSGTSLTIQTATTSQPGLLSSADWNTFNGKQAAGNYITALTGDVSASGPGSVAASIASTTVTGKVLTGFSAGAGTVAATDTILQGFNKVVGNIALLAPKANPIFTGSASYSDGTNAYNLAPKWPVSAVTCTTTGTVDFNSQSAATVELDLTSSDACTLTVSGMVTGGAYVLKVKFASGATVVWPVSFDWGSAGAPTLAGPYDDVHLLVQQSTANVHAYSSLGFSN